MHLLLIISLYLLLIFLYSLCSIYLLAYKILYQSLCHPQSTPLARYNRRKLYMFLLSPYKFENSLECLEALKHLLLIYLCS
ncbi:hypothetical protein FDF54_07100 [Clostridium botulinum]|nr:hypothetical protein [Clostridium botulinum F str. Langeland]NFL11917.1 hypothetical protein [Clostridium botulinum]NFL16261.1 hypothetical protein [Clostridium botulinum]NFL22136.1 hypothetical protein [Clostridium botulinum]NFM19306.1 hypothetical protein [Clostridium botulinum]